MPELPEVETICRGIRPHIVDRQVAGILYSGKQLRKPIDMLKMQGTLIGKTITSVTRRAKYIVVQFDDNSLLTIHLGMTGNLGIFSPEVEQAKHCHLQFLLSNGMELRFTDARRFGSVELFDSNSAIKPEETLFKNTGPDPFSSGFNTDYLLTAAKNRRIPVKAFIMTNSVVTGVGNIYANESLFEAGINPQRPVNSMRRKEWNTLVSAIRQTLALAIECGGSTISDYINANQENGYFQMNFRIYGKNNQDCSICNSTINKTQIGGRASYWCPHCQQ